MRQSMRGCPACGQPMRESTRRRGEYSCACGSIADLTHPDMPSSASDAAEFYDMLGYDPDDYSER